MARARKDRRHRAREAALQILYQWEVGRGDVDRAAETFFDAAVAGRRAAGRRAARVRHGAGARHGASGSTRSIALIAETAERWRPERMAVIDRLILRMAVCELLRDPETPPAVVINEALELARTFSTEESVKFINGMLDAIRKKMEGLTAERHKSEDHVKADG